MKLRKLVIRVRGERAKGERGSQLKGKKGLERGDTKVRECAPIERARVINHYLTRADEAEGHFLLVYHL